MRTQALILFGIVFTATAIAKDFIVDLTQGKETNGIFVMEQQDTVEVRLDETPSTGFKWHVANQYVNHIQFLNLLDSQYIPNEQPEISEEDEESEETETPVIGGAMGAAGVRTFTFVAQRTGEQRLHLVNARSWEVQGIIGQDGEVDIEKAKELKIQYTYKPVDFIIKETSVKKSKVFLA